MSKSALSLFFVLGVLVVPPALAQLNGNYTVDNTVPTGGTNYNTLTEAAAAIVAQGVSGPVVFAINTGSGPYVGFGIAGPFPGSSATNLVTFAPGAGQSPVISGPASGNVQTIKLGTSTTVGSGPSNIVLFGLTVTGAPTGAKIITAGCNNITIQQCATYGVAGETGSGIYLAATTNSVVKGCQVYNVGMTPGTPGSVTYSGGIGVYLSSSACTVAGNRVHDCVGCGIHIGTSGPTTAVTNCSVINNFVWNCPGTGTYTSGGISTRRTGGLILANNSVRMASGANAGIFMTATDGGASAEVSNNVIQHVGTGPCFKFEATGTLAATVFDYNLYDPSPTAFVGAVGAVNYSTLSAWQAVAGPNLAGKEVNTLVGTSGYVATTDLHITSASAGLHNGSTVAAVTLDIDGNPRVPPPCRGAHELSCVGPCPPPPCNLWFTSPNGPGSIKMDHGACGALAGAWYLVAFTFVPGAYPNGWFYGLDITIPALNTWFTSGYPFTGTLNGAGAAAFGPTSGGFLPSGFQFWAVSTLWAPGFTSFLYAYPPRTYTIP